MPRVPATGFIICQGAVNTLIFQDKIDAWKYLTHKSHPIPNILEMNTEILNEARKRNIDSIQYMASGMTANICNGHGIYTFEIQFITTESISRYRLEASYLSIDSEFLDQYIYRLHDGVVGMLSKKSTDDPADCTAMAVPTSYVPGIRIDHETLLWLERSSAIRMP